MSHWNDMPTHVHGFRRRTGLIGIIHKATQGTDFIDDTYVPRRAIAAGQSLLWGAYHYMAAGNAAAQAAYFLSTAQPDAGTLLAVDHEDPTVPISDLREFCAAVTTAAPAHKLVIYSNNVIQEQLAGVADPDLGQYRLWHAEITSGTPTWASATWPKFWIWQYSKSTILSGTSTPIDFSTYIGSRADLASDWVNGTNQAMAYT
jgi:GH25 family lysozyme M1 (1,4-beta-N-acetylmuramidase)